MHTAVNARLSSPELARANAPKFRSEIHPAQQLRERKKRQARRRCRNRIVFRRVCPEYFLLDQKVGARALYVDDLVLAFARSDKFQAADARQKCRSQSVNGDSLP